MAGVRVVAFDLRRTVRHHGVWRTRADSATADERAAAEASGVHIVTSLEDVPALLAR
jgi:hypothetical protein